MSAYSDVEIQFNERVSIANGSFAMIGINIVSNFAPLFVLSALHATAQDMALLNALPSLMAIVSMWVGAILLANTSSKKWFCIRATATARMFYGLLAVTPFLIHGPSLALIIVVLIALMNVPASLSALSWTSLIGDLIPGERRAVFFGKRNRVMTFIGMLATLIPGLLLQLFPAANIPPYAALFIVSMLFSVLEVYYLIRHREHVDKRPDQATAAFYHPRIFLSYLKRRPYMLFLLGSVVFNLGWQMAWPLFNIYQIKYAGATALWISAFTVANQVSQILTFHFWSRYSERFGNTMMLAVACAGMAIAPVLTILSKSLYYLTAINLVTGSFVGGIGLLLFNHLLEVAPESERTSYIAHYNIVIGLVGFVAPELGVLCLNWLRMDGSMITASAVRIVGTVVFFLTARQALRAVRKNALTT